MADMSWLVISWWSVWVWKVNDLVPYPYLHSANRLLPTTLKAS